MHIEARTEPVARFDNRAAQRALVCFSLLVLFIGAGGVSSPESRGQGAFFLALGVVSLGRAVRSSRVDVGTDEVVTRSMIRTRRYQFEELSDVEVEIGRTGLNGLDREYLVFHCANGDAVSFKELNCRPSPDAPSLVRRAANCIAERLSPR